MLPTLLRGCPKSPEKGATKPRQGGRGLQKGVTNPPKDDHGLPHWRVFYEKLGSVLLHKICLAISTEEPDTQSVQLHLIYNLSV